MPMAEYREVKALSYTGIKSLIKSPTKYYENVIQGKFKPSPQKTYGSALHDALLMGAHYFVKNYCTPPNEADYDFLLKTNKQMKDYLKALDQKVSGTKADLIKRIRAIDSDVDIWEEILNTYKDLYSNYTELPNDTYNKVYKVADSFNDDDIKPYLTGGYPEVSIFWQMYGVQMKARLDYLQISGINDIKTVSVHDNSSIAAEVSKIVCGYRYDLQAAVYISGLKETLKTSFDTDANAEQIAFLEKLKAKDKFNMPFNLLMVECPNDIPSFVIATLTEFDTLAGAGATPNAYWNKSYNEMLYAINLYKSFVLKFGFNKPWKTETLHMMMTDADFPIYHLNKEVTFYAIF
jgi:hypothetical protein